VDAALEVLSNLHLGYLFWLREEVIFSRFVVNDLNKKALATSECLFLKMKGMN